VKELRRDSKGVRCWRVRRKDQIVVAMLAPPGGSLFQRVGTASGYKERSANFSDEVTEGRRSVRAEEERVERDGW